MSESSGDKGPILIDAIKSPEEAPINVQAITLSIWLLNNLLVTIINKVAFAKVDFKYPYSLSAVHMATNILGAQLYFMFSKSVKPKQLEATGRQNIVIFSVIFALNIAYGNTSLRWVSVNFNQMSKSLVPIVVMFISTVFYRRVFSAERRWSVLPIVLGVALAFYGDITCTSVGAFYTGLSVVLAALKGVLGGELLSGDLKLHEMDLLLKICPFALLQIGFLAIFSGEVSAILDHWPALSASSAPQIVLLSGVLSFTLNISSFTANKVTSALTLCIAANLKQILVVGTASLYFQDSISLVNALGYLLAIYGSYRYGVATIHDSQLVKDKSSNNSNNMIANSNNNNNNLMLNSSNNNNNNSSESSSHSGAVSNVNGLIVSNSGVFLGANSGTHSSSHGSNGIGNNGGGSNLV